MFTCQPWEERQILSPFQESLAVLTPLFKCTQSTQIHSKELAWLSEAATELTHSRIKTMRIKHPSQSLGLPSTMERVPLTTQITSLMIQFTFMEVPRIPLCQLFSKMAKKNTTTTITRMSWKWLRKRMVIMSLQSSSITSSIMSSTAFWWEESKTGIDARPQIALTIWLVTCSPICSQTCQRTPSLLSMNQQQIGGQQELSGGSIKTSLSRLKHSNSTDWPGMDTYTIQILARPSLARSICISTDVLKSSKDGLIMPLPLSVLFNTPLLMTSLSFSHKVRWLFLQSTQCLAWLRSTSWTQSKNRNS